MTINTNTVRQVYHKWTEDEPFGYPVGCTNIGHAAIDMIRGLCDEVDSLRVDRDRLREDMRIIATIDAHEGWTGAELKAHFVDGGERPHKGNDYEHAFGFAQAVALAALTTEGPEQ